MSLERYEAMKADGNRKAAPDDGRDERLARIVAAALEVFSELSFRSATTQEIARRARVSKRDLYANFPCKQDLLIGVIKMVLQQDDAHIAAAIEQTRETASLQERLEAIGLALMNEVLSAAMGFLARLIPSESIGQPVIGSIYFENGHVRRSRAIEGVLSNHLSRAGAASTGTDEAAQHYLALVTHLPYMSTLAGMRDMWDTKSVQAHVQSAVRCFVRAHPELVG
jgi:AcrR family transcriptional regulator